MWLVAEVVEVLAAVLTERQQGEEGGDGEYAGQQAPQGDGAVRYGVDGELQEGAVHGGG